jgi:hypothetical protein
MKVPDFLLGLVIGLFAGAAVILAMTMKTACSKW